MSAAAELATRLRLSDPKPSRCAACWSGAEADIRFIDFDAAIDRGAFINENSGAVIDSVDELHLCESCVRQAAEVLGYKPELHRRQLLEIRRLEIENAHWRDTAKRFQGEVDKQIEVQLSRGEQPAKRRGG